MEDDKPYTKGKVTKDYKPYTELDGITPRHFGFIGDGGPGDAVATVEYLKYMNGGEAMKDYKLEVVVNGVRYVREDLSDSEREDPVWQKIHQLGKKEGREELQEELRNFLGLEI